MADEEPTPNEQVNELLDTIDNLLAQVRFQVNRIEKKLNGKPDD